MTDGYVCQRCGKEFTLDVYVPDSLWELIRPIEKPRLGGLLCGLCIFKSLERLNAKGKLPGTYLDVEIMP